MYNVFKNKYEKCEKCDKCEKISELEIENIKLKKDIQNLRNILADLCLIRISIG